MAGEMTPLKSLDARYYTDPEIFAVESNGLLASSWQFAGHASQLQKPGDYFTFEMAGESLFLSWIEMAASTHSTMSVSIVRISLSAEVDIQS